MASEFGERVKLVGLSIGDQAGAFAEVATPAEALVPTVGEIVLEIEEIDVHIEQLRTSAGELAAKLVAVKAEIERHVSDTGTVYQRLEDASEAAHNLLEGTRSELAQEGLSKASRSLAAVERAQYDGNSAKVRMESMVVMLSTDLMRVLNAIHTQLAAVREVSIEAGESAGNFKEGLATSAELATAAKDDLVSYGDGV